MNDLTATDFKGFIVVVDAGYGKTTVDPVAVCPLVPVIVTETVLDVEAVTYPCVVVLVAVVADVLSPKFHTY